MEVMPYDQLAFHLGTLSTACKANWPEALHPWSAIFLADYIRGLISVSDFMTWFPLPNSDYLDLGQCIRDYVESQ